MWSLEDGKDSISVLNINVLSMLKWIKLEDTELQYDGNIYEIYIL